jgi:WD40 repeat protein
MFSNQPAEISLNTPVRALDAVRAEKVESRFVVGSCTTAAEENQLHVVRFHSELNQLGIDAVLAHPTGPIRKVCTSPHDKSLLITLSETSSSATLWRIPREMMDKQDEMDFDEDTANATASDPNDGAVTSMEQLAILGPADATKTLVDICWRGAEEEASPYGDCLTLSQDGQITQWDLSVGTAEQSRQLTCGVEGSQWNLPPCMAWDPHNPETTAVAAGTKTHLVDWRANNHASASIMGDNVHSFSCHRYGIMDLDYNPNKPYVLTTAGQDGLLKFWDLRSAKQPLLVARGGHRHWASRVLYNPFHDQLVLSAGTDSLVNLWRVSTISSAPLLTLNELNGEGDQEQSETSAPNVRVARYEHMDSVYAMAWGAADAWVYVTVGYDGKVVLNHVPSKEKYKILL